MPRLTNAKSRRKAAKAAKRTAKKGAPAKKISPPRPDDRHVTEAFNRATRV